MKTKETFLAVAFIFISSMMVSAQPYTLDKNLKPILLELKQNENGKGKLVITNTDLNQKELYYHVKGHDMFEFVDVYVFSNIGNPNFKVELAHNNWKDVQFTETTSKAEDGIINFKLRAYDAFGLHIYPADEETNITIAIGATEPSMTYLDSPFRKATKAELGEAVESDTQVLAGTPSEGSSNMFLYIIIGIAALVIALLLGILLGRRKSATILIILLGSFSMLSAQRGGGATWHDVKQYQEWLKSQAESNRNGPWQRAGDVRDGVNRANRFFGDLSNKVNQAVDLYKVANSLYEAHKNLGSCMRSTPPPGMPSIPSFCESNECQQCFVDARTALNKNRYTLEKLKTIYDCTKNYTDVAIAFGNSFSSLPGGGGMAWGFERIKLEKSINKLKNSYDQKYQELMQHQQQLLMDLNDCENEHGLPDWYDRFGHLLYEFNAMYYKRSS